LLLNIFIIHPSITEKRITYYKLTERIQNYKTPKSKLKYNNQTASPLSRTYAIQGRNQLRTLYQAKE